MLHGLCFGGEAGARNLVFFRVKWLQSAMKRTSCLRRLRLRSVCLFFLPHCNGGFKLLWVCLCVRSQRVFWNLWLQWNGYMIVTTFCCHVCVETCGFATKLVPPLCSATSGCSCVRSFMRFLNLWLQIALEWLHDCCHALLPCA